MYRLYIFFINLANTISYFGSYVPMNINELSYLKFISLSSMSILLANSEFKFDAMISGFEFYSKYNGNIEIYVKLLL